MRRCAIVLLAVCGLAACGPADPFARSGRLRVTAAEDTWGSLAAQLGGTRAVVHSVIADPDVDPHAYEPTASDAVAFARAQVAIVNGLGYDPWAARLLAVDSSRATVDVGRVLGLGTGANPHQWYSPGAVARVIDAIAGVYARLDPRDAAYFERRRAAVVGSLAPYRALIARIRACCSGTPVGYSESAFAPLAHALDLRLATPTGFARAVADGTDVSVADKQAVDRAIAGRRIAVWVYNRQDLTPDVQRVNALARARRIPVVAITETLQGPTFQAWQERQLERLREALRPR